MVLPVLRVLGRPVLLEGLRGALVLLSLAELRRALLGGLVAGLLDLLHSLRVLLQVLVCCLHALLLQVVLAAVAVVGSLDLGGGLFERIRARGVWSRSRRVTGAAAQVGGCSAAVVVSSSAASVASSVVPSRVAAAVCCHSSRTIPSAEPAISSVVAKAVPAAAVAMVGCGHGAGCRSQEGEEGGDLHGLCRGGRRLGRTV